MANEGYDRDFPGNPNPTPKAPAARGFSGAAVAEEEESGGVGPVASPKPATTSAPLAEISAVESADGFELYLATDDDPAVPMGRATKEATEILRASGAWYNADARAWEGVPEDVAAALPKGRLGFTEQMLARYRSGEAGLARMALGLMTSRGRMTPEDALERGRPDLLKTQFTERPDRVWEGLGGVLAHPWKALRDPEGTARSIGGSLAEQVPFLTGLLSAAVKGGTKGAAAGAAAGVAATVTTGGVAFPAAVAAVTGGASVMATYEMWKYATEVGEGETAIQMAEKGASHKAIQDLAPLAGVIKGTLDMASFSVMTAPIKRGFIKTVLNDPRVKTAMAKWYVTYATTIGAEVTTELAQTRVDQIALSFAAQIDDNPDLVLKPDEAANELWNTAVEAFNVSGVLGGAGVAVEGATNKLAARAEKVKAAQVEGVDRTLTLDTSALPAAAAAAGPAAAEAQIYAGEKAADQIEKTVDQFDKGKITPEELAEKIDPIIEKSSQELDTTPRTYGEKVNAAEVKARIAKAQADLDDVTTLIEEVSQVRERLARNNQSTALLDTKIEAWQEEQTGFRADIEFYEKTGPVAGVSGEPGAQLLMRPDTFERVLGVALKEGRKDVLDVRRKSILDVAEKLELTPTELRGILKDKNYGTMGDVEFKNFLENKFKPAAKIATKRRIALRELEEVQAEKEIGKEARIRVLNELPPVKKMTEEQLRQYADILRTYNKGDTPLTPSLIEANETGIYAGARTFEEVLARAAKHADQPIESLRAAGATSELDLFTPIPHVADKNPHYGFAVQQHDAITAKWGFRLTQIKAQIRALGAKAMASRARGAGQVLSPRMPEVMAWLEADKNMAYAGQTALPELTPEELAFAQFARVLLDNDYEYLVLSDGTESRFAGGNYMFHMAKDIGEILADIPNKGLVAAAKAIRKRWDASRKEIVISDNKGKIVGRRKFIHEMLFRSGELDPSQNVIKALLTYQEHIHRKRALDEIIPIVETAITAAKVTSEVKDLEEVRALFQDTDKWVAGYLRTQKGQSVLNDIVRQGGRIDGAIRLLSSYISFMYIAGNIKLQLTAFAGETAAAIPAIRLKGLGVGGYRLSQSAGRAMIKKYEHFTGVLPVIEAFRPGASIDDKVGALVYGIIQTGRHIIFNTAFLASLTDAEFNSGTVSDARIAEMKKKLGRWMDLPGNKSLFGSTSTGATISKFRGWAVPVILSVGENLQAVGELIKSKGAKKLTSDQKSELLGMVESLSVALAISALVRGDREDEELETWEKKLLMEIWTLIGALSPALVLSFGPTVGFITQLGKNATLLGQTYEKGDREGQNKGVVALKKQLFTPAIWRQFQQEDE